MNTDPPSAHTARAPPPAIRDLRVLIVADPAEDARLPGAALEGMRVAEALVVVGSEELEPGAGWKYDAIL